VKAFQCCFARVAPEYFVDVFFSPHNSRAALPRESGDSSSHGFPPCLFTGCCDLAVLSPLPPLGTSSASQDSLGRLGLLMVFVSSTPPPVGNCASRQEPRFLSETLGFFSIFSTAYKNRGFLLCSPPLCVFHRPPTKR